jgi:NAD(P)-dependent dehydrogenase (short-subunit alcohol dehydrogenase family)
MITLDVNLAGALLTAELAQQYWKAEPADRDRQIVLIASMGEYRMSRWLHQTLSLVHYLFVGGHLGIPGGPLYSASKHGLVGYWTALCAKLRRTNSKEFS